MKKVKLNKKNKNVSVSKKSNTKNKSKLKLDFKRFKNRWKSGNIGEKILTIIMAFIVFVFMLGLAFILYIVISAPEFDAERLYTKEASIIYDASGNEIARLGTENRERVSYEELPEVFIDALVATEDSRFFQHNGVDMARFLKATVGQLLGRSGAGGASTLTMQIAKQRFNGNEASGIKGIVRKFSDMYISLFKLEKNYTKEQLIEFYVNIPQFSGSAFGIEQASQKYFGKSISEVNLSEAALLAGLFQAPSAYNPFSSPNKAEARRNQVLNLMKRHGYITNEECELAKSIKVEDMIVSSSASSNKYQGFINTVVEEVKKRTGHNPYTMAMKIYSTMIPAKQDYVNEIYSGKIYTWPNDAIQAGIAVTDVKTGALIAVGASRNNGELVFNYATMINRHPGSSAKPIFDYGPAIEYLNWSTGQTIVDDVYTYSNGLSIKNWDNGYRGIMTAKTALASSRNIPALQAFQAVNQADINKFVTGLGITPEYEKGSTFINESHSIGGFNGVNPLQMSAAYGAFARGGIYIEPYSFTKVEYLDTGEIYTVTPEKRTVMSEATAFMINMILKYAVTSGNVTAGSKSGTDIASKTGTSTVDSSVKKAKGITENIIGDSWQVSYSPNYVCAVWVGYDEITKEHYLTSKVGGNARKTLSKLLTSGIQEPNSTWKKPSSVVTAPVELETIPLQLASDYTPDNLRSTEYFKAGTLPEVSTRFSQLSNPSNLKANYTYGSVNLTWTAIKTPDAIDINYLTNYYKEGYKTFADKYLQRRLDYNNQHIGKNGYHVYISNSSGGYTDLGFTTNTNYTYTGTLSETTTFMVKSSYSIFKSNMSSGVTVTVNPVGDVPTTKTASDNWKIELNGSKEMTVQGYYDFINAGSNPVKITDNGTDVTSNAKITTTCWNSSNNEVSCQTMDCNEEYYIQHSVSYNNKNKSVSRTLKAGC